jgi:hypothetical protein
MPAVPLYGLVELPLDFLMYQIEVVKADVGEHMGVEFPEHCQFTCRAAVVADSGEEGGEAGCRKARGGPAGGDKRKHGHLHLPRFVRCEAEVPMRIRCGDPMSGGAGRL